VRFMLLPALMLLQAPPETVPGGSRADIVGSTFTHRVRPGETLSLIGARYGVDWKLLADENGLGEPYALETGEELRIDNRHIVPAAPTETGIVINLPQRMLFYFADAGLLGAYPVAIGRLESPSPTGSYEVATLIEDPVWNVPCSIQEEMEREGQTPVEQVPSGPGNPLGAYWIGLSLPTYGIHGTNDPASIYGLRSHGCIRLHPDDIEALFALVTRGTPVHLIYEPVLVAALPDGRVFAEVHADVYGRAEEAAVVLERLIRELGADGIAARALADTLDEEAGVARQVFP
jgi:L,D-transpeptidase ErfK/SrfK